MNRIETGEVLKSMKSTVLRNTTQMEHGRSWSWAALVAALVVWMATLPTLGLSVVLAPLTSALSVVAWRRSGHDTVFWIGFALNVFLVLSLLGEIVSVMIGESSVGWE